jgi:PAS domain S-box-containing protein
MRLRLPPPPKLHPAVSLALSIAAPVAATLVGLSLRPLIFAIPMALFFLVVAVVSFAAGLRAGALSIVTSSMLGGWWFIAPYHTLAVSRNEVFALSVFVPVAAILAVLADSLRSGYAERAESETWFRTLAETIPYVVFTVRRNGASEYCNGRLAEYAGIPVEALRGDGWKGTIHADDLPIADVAIERAFASGERAEASFRMRRADGEWRWFAVALVPIRAVDGGVLRCVGSATDVQQQKDAADAHARAIEARDVFLSVASHELKTPIAAALLQIQRAQRLVSAEGTAAYPPVLVKSLLASVGTIERLDGLVGSLLDVSRISTGQLSLARSTYDLSAATSAVAARFSEAARRAGCVVELDVEPGIEAVGDRQRIEQVLTNLVSNALKYGAGKPVSIALRRRGGTAIASVSDHGIGIASEDHARVFERFERGASARHYGGLGLGLWIARQIAEASGGYIRLASRPGDGATFSVELPLTAS